MKKIFMFAAFAIAAVSSMAQVKYTISGTYDANGKKIYLKDELTEKNIDSTLVAAGKFSFTGTADKDALMAVKTQKGNLAMEFFNDGTPVIVNYMRHTRHFATNHTNHPNLCRAILSQYLSEFRSLAFEDCDVDLDLASGSIGSGILTRQVCCNKEILRATRNLT